ncbi:MAG: type II toxin-antitoxin system VapC family toxin [Caldilineaceae bacterium]|nr:type II toxin-antitoxin system VapC family toxin [Caldilineaceae bacterium]
MVIDSSAFIAILSAEPEAESFTGDIALDSTRLLSAASLLETAIVIENRYGTAGGQKLDLLVETAQIRIESVTVEQVSVARLAYQSYGKGKHKASLNFGDCFAYALAKVTREQLLCKGEDFSHTDLQLAEIR